MASATSEPRISVDSILQVNRLERVLRDRVYALLLREAELGNRPADVQALAREALKQMLEEMKPEVAQSELVA